MRNVKIRRAAALLLAAVMSVGMLAGCGKSGDQQVDIELAPVEAPKSDVMDSLKQDESFLDRTAIPAEDKAADTGAMTAVTSHDPALALDMMPKADGVHVKENEKAIVDYSHTDDGYVMVKWKSEKSSKIIKCLIYGPGVNKQEDAWQYDCEPGQWEVFPLSNGSGKYKLTVYEQLSGDRYATVLTETLNVSITDEFAPFLRPNQYVNYQDNAEKALTKAAELVNKNADVFTNIDAVYHYVVDNFTYDREKAKTVQSGYVPVLNDVMDAQTGICFDYASLMTAMLRSQGYPCKLVVGYAGTAYHAWVSVWSEETGWIDGAIFFDGETWQRMDPTFASSGNNSSAILKYIGDGSHYNARFLY